MKTYIGIRDPEQGTFVVVVEDSPPDAHFLRHVIYHSPTGLEWGYGGSGPADTALSVLADFFGETATLPPAVFTGYSAKDISAIERTKAGKLHQYFKQAVVAGLDKEWKLTDTQVDETVRRLVVEHQLCPACYGRTVAIAGERKCSNIECPESPWYEPPTPSQPDETQP